MLETLALILLILWLLGLISGSVGSLVHILLVGALILFLARFLDRRL